MSGGAGSPAPAPGRPRHDPFTLEIIQASLQAVSDEMFAALRQTAMSAIIYEVLDAGTAVTGAAGELASSGAGIPTFVGVLDKAVARILELHGPEGIAAGDLFVTNDPAYGGVTHLNDVVLALPVFVGGELLAWTAAIAHWNDVGGAVPGSVSTRASEIFQEGLRLPAVRLFCRGEPIRPVMEIMAANSRLPDFLAGDMWAAIAAVKVGERRLLELVAKYGREAFLSAIAGHLEHGEWIMRAALAALPHGRYALVEEQDDGSLYRVEVEIGAEAFVVDLRDNPEQDPGPNNVSRDGAVIAAQMALMNLAGVQGSANAGHFRPLRVLTRPGSVFDPAPTAACSLYYEVRIRLHDLILRCLAPHLGERLPAGHFASICGTFIGGLHPETGRSFTIVEPQVGGWGGSALADGNSAMFSAFHGETFNCPAEVAEARYGLDVERLELNPAPGGEGRQRGGKGILLEYRVRSDGCFLTCSFSRSRHPPWPLRGGCEGSANIVEVERLDGTIERFAVVTTLRLDRGDLVRIRTGNGAGYGDPRERAPELVRDDLRDGYLTPERASEIYGRGVPDAGEAAARRVSDAGGEQDRC